jgi:hypothetical protein
MMCFPANQPNRVQQLSECCVYCGKSYKMRKTLDRHMILCQVTYKSKQRRFVIDDDIADDQLPSQKMLYKMVIELTLKCNRLEEKLEEVNKWVVKKKKSINVLEWLKNNIVPHYDFNAIIEHIHVTNSDIEYLLKNTFYDTMNEVFSKSIYNDKLPIACFGQKANTFYIYRNGEWKELANDDLTKFMNYVFAKIYKHMLQWYQSNKEQINSNENASITYNKTISKLMSLDFKEEGVLSKAKSVIHNKLKRDLKTLVEYEIDF